MSVSHQDKAPVPSLLILRILLVSALCWATFSQDSEASLTQAQAYACQIQAYLIKVVLGIEGNLSMRQKWSATGLEERLDLEAISDAMLGRKGSEFNYMLLDYNLSDLLNVLYYWDPDLNLHRGSLGILSPYPSPEFLAMRLFLLKRLHSGTPLRLGALITKEGLLHDSITSADKHDTAGSGLSLEEKVFLRDVVASQPRILDYMKCPFLVRSLMEAGILEKDAHAEEMASKAVYGPLAMAIIKGDPSAKRKIVFLPSFTRHFAVEPGGSGALKASEELYRLAGKLAQAITDYAAKLASKGDPEPHSPGRATLLKDTAFFLENERPLAIYPGNAGEAAKAICPSAELTVIMLDKNVRLSFHDLPKPSPERPWIFVDALDIEYGQLTEELDTIAAFLLIRNPPAETFPAEKP